MLISVVKFTYLVIAFVLSHSIFFVLCAFQGEIGAPGQIGPIGNRGPAVSGSFVSFFFVPRKKFLVSELWFLSFCFRSSICHAASFFNKK